MLAAQQSTQTMDVGVFPSRVVPLAKVISFSLAIIIAALVPPVITTFIALSTYMLIILDVYFTLIITFMLLLTRIMGLPPSPPLSS